MAGVVALGLERAQEVMSLFYAPAQALDVDVPRVLRRLAPLDTPLEQYAGLIGRLRSAAEAAQEAAPSEVGLCVCTGQLPICAGGWPYAGCVFSSHNHSVQAVWFVFTSNLCWLLSLCWLYGLSFLLCIC